MSWEGIRMEQAAPPVPSGTVTFLFTDIEGSTKLWEQHPEAMGAALARHDALVRAAILAHGGHVFKTVGDQFCAAFATAPNAIAAALAAQRALHAERWSKVGPLWVRMALNTGAVEQREGDYFGPALNRVARLLEAGHGGQVVLSLATEELARDHLPDGTTLCDLGEHRLKDLTRPERIFQLRHPDLPADFPRLNTLDLRPHNLPAQLTPLIGREREVEAVRSLLGKGAGSEAESRLVTLTGPGGTGKTRLGLQVAATLLDALGDGVYFVPLAPITDEGLVIPTIAQTLDVPETAGTPRIESLKAYLREKHLLLLLDNFEQVLGAAPQVAELLASCPKLEVLVTSRAVLRLHGEKEFLVPPLDLPDRRHLPPLPVLSQYAALALFTQRARDVRPDFSVTDETAPAVAEICHRLDGLPLAIELAAARIKLFAPGALLGRLEKPLKLLTGGAKDLPTRQQTLRNTIAWSYDLLEESEQKLFRRLAVFVGGFTLEAAEVVVNVEERDAADVLDGVVSLADKSLLRPHPGLAGEPRFTMLETIREFGLECLVSSGEAEAVRSKHAHFFLSLAEQAEPQLHGAQQRTWLERLETEHDNVRAALEGCEAEPTCAGNAEVAVILAGTLGSFWRMRGHFAEGRQRLSKALSVATTDASAARGKALLEAGSLAMSQGDYPSARSHHEEALAIGTELSESRILAGAQVGLGNVALSLGNASAGDALIRAGLAIQRALEDNPGIAASLLGLGNSAKARPDYEAARAHFEESLTLFRTLGDRYGIANALNGLGGVVSHRGDYAQAAAFYEESLAIRKELGDSRGVAGSLHNLAKLALTQYDYSRARRLMEEAIATNRLMGNRAWEALNLDQFGHIALAQGDYEGARAHYAARLAIDQELGLQTPPVNLGHVALAEGNYDRARILYQESLPVMVELDKVAAAECLEGLAGVACGAGQTARAARLFGAAEALLESIGARLEQVDHPHYDRCVSAARATLGEEVFAAAWAEGRAMTLEEAMTFALEEWDDV